MATFHAPDLTTFCCLDELGLELTSQTCRSVFRPWAL